MIGQNKGPQGVFPGPPKYNGKTFDLCVRYVSTGEYRPPRAGEYYLSGAITEAYQVHHDLVSPYWIAKPIKMKQCPCCKGTGKVVSQ